MKLADKIKTFFRNKAPTMQEMIEFHQSRYQIKQEGNVFDPPFVAKVVRPFYRFWLNNWKWLIGTIIAFSILVVMILK